MIFTSCRKIKNKTAEAGKAGGENSGGAGSWHEQSISLSSSMVACAHAVMCESFRDVGLWEVRIPVALPEEGPFNHSNHRARRALSLCCLQTALSVGRSGV